MFRVSLVLPVRVNDGVGVVPRRAVTSEQGVGLEGTEHAPRLEAQRISVEDQRGGCVVTYPYHLGAA